MTIDERFARIEPVTDGLAEQQRKDQEESRRLWRDTQRQLSDATLRLNEVTLKLADFADERRAGQEELRGAIKDFVDESKAADARLEKRIENLTSAMGEFIRNIPKYGQPGN